MTILFGSDWAKHPTAIVDYDTTNKSFLRLASVYRVMGIKNHAFILSLVNPRLKGINPHSNNLTLEQQAMVALECKVNWWYYFREVLRIPAIAGGDAVPLIANRANIALYWSFCCHITFFLIQPRQTGKSVSTDGLMALLLNIACSNTQINLLTKDDVLRRKNVERIKAIVAELPGYLQQRTRSDANNGEEITVKSLDNEYVTHVPQSSVKRAQNQGRGLTSPIFQIDEAPFQANIQHSLKAALAAGGAARLKAEENNAPFGTIFTTTAGKQNDDEGKFIYKLLCESANWTERFFDAQNQDDLYDMVKKSGRGVIRINGTFSHRQLGFTDEWLKRQLEDAVQSGEEADRDYFNIWTSGGIGNPLPVKILERIAASKRDVVYTEISKGQNYITRWYINENQIQSQLNSCSHVLSLDTSDASGGDDIGLTLVDVEALELVAAGNYNETNLINFVHFIADFIIKYPKITLIIERKSSAIMILDYLLIILTSKGIDPFARIFNKVVQEKDENKSRYDEIKGPMSRRDSDIYVRYKKLFGFTTSGGTGTYSRSELYSTTLQKAFKRSCDKVYDSVLIEQVLGLITKNGRVDHGEGKHDDMVISYLLVHWLITQGTNLIHYGIDVSRVGSKLVEIVNIIDSKELAKRREQQMIREKITSIFEQLSNCSDQYVSMKLEQELRLLDRRIIVEDDEIYSVDEIIKQANENRRSKRYGIRLNR